MELSGDLREFVEWFLSNKVEFIIVGAHAMAFHRPPRLTGDVDLFVSTSGGNPKRIVKAIEEFGFGSFGITIETLSVADQIVQLGRAPNRIDIMTSISGVSFQEAWATRVCGMIEGLQVPFISRELLMKNKAATGRDRDLLDLKLLRQSTPGDQDDHPSG